MECLLEMGRKFLSECILLQEVVCYHGRKGSNLSSNGLIYRRGLNPAGITKRDF
jgi:hypothetical protein